MEIDPKFTDNLHQVLARATDVADRAIQEGAGEDDSRVQLARCVTDLTLAITVIALKLDMEWITNGPGIDIDRAGEG